MFNFASFLDLPLIWYALITTAIFLYVILDGFDLGVGILFPFAPSDKCRDRMMNSIAPFWDGNETFLGLCPIYGKWSGNQAGLSLKTFGFMDKCNFKADPTSHEIVIINPAAR